MAHEAAPKSGPMANPKGSGNTAHESRHAGEANKPDSSGMCKIV